MPDINLHICDILAELQAQDKNIILCKVSAHLEIKVKESAKQANMYQELSQQDYYLTIRKAKNSEWQKEWKNSTSKLHYIKPRIKE